jgi:hypothetical protein
LLPVSRLCQGGPAAFDCAVKHVQDHSSQQLLPVREVAVQRSYADAGSCGDGVHRGLVASFKYQFDGSVDESPSVPPRVGPHEQPSQDVATRQP